MQEFKPSRLIQGAIRFSVFEADLQAGELRKRGVKIKLQDKPFQILAALLENPGQVVTREELRARLWPADTFVDFERSLNIGMVKLRAALGDSADTPRFVETLPRRGYRFIAPVTSNGGATRDRLGADSQQSDEERPAERHLPHAAILVTASVLGIVALAYWLRPSLPAPKVLRIVQLTDDRRPKPGGMVTDGARLYFTEQITGRLTLVTVSTAGGEVVPIQTPIHDPEILDISLDGSELLMNTNAKGNPGQQLWVVPVMGGPPRRLGDLEASEATWSPDGEEILYIKGFGGSDPNLYLAKSDGSASRVLAKVPGNPYFIRWSPDGRHISVSVFNGRSNTLWEVSADGTNLHPVLPGWNFDGAACNGHWTPDGNYLLFDSYRGGADNIWAIREKQSILRKTSPQPVQLTTGPLNVGGPLLSKDGKRIFVTGTVPRPQLHRYDSKSGEWKPFLSGISAEHVDLSRDGQWAAYVSYPDAILFRSKLDGSQKLQLTAPPLQAAMPRISPDGKSIAYMARTPGQMWRIYLVSANGGSARPLSPGDAGGAEPSWSPDGRSLVFCRTSPTSDDIIEVLDMETNRISALTHGVSPFYPRWSPDGRSIAAIGDDFRAVMLLDLRTGKWEVLFKSPGKEPYVYEPSWSHDGRSIYFVDYTADAPGYYRVRIRDHKVERVVALGMDVPDMGGITGGWHALTSDDSLLSLLNEHYEEIYALDWEAP